MDWIKRNLIFVISAVVALGLMGVAGFYNFSGWKHNADEREKLNGAYEELKRLNTLNPHPGGGKVDNIKLAREQQKELQDFIAKVARHFAPIAAIPQSTKVSGKELSSALQQTIDQLQREAANNSVILPPNYKFSFEAHLGRVQFAAGSLGPLAVQLGEVKTIAGILNLAKINALDGIRRERVSADDAAGSPTDYLDLKSTTNELAVITPYEVTFRCFTPELASVLSGLAASPHGLLVKSINVEPAAVTVESEPLAAAAAPVYHAAPPVAVPPRDAEQAFRSRYGLSGKDRPGPAPAPAAPVAVAAPVARATVQTLVKERQLKVTMLIHVVKLLPPQIARMDLLKKHYEKILLGGVLLTLAVSAALLPMMISGERDELRTKADAIINLPPKALPPLNLSTQEVTLRQLEAGLRIDLATSNKVFNPVLWQKMPDGRLIKIQTGEEVGPRALVVTKQTPLYFIVTFDSVSTNEAGAARYSIGVEREASPDVAKRRKKPYYVNVGNKNDAFLLREVKVAADGGIELDLELTDTGEAVRLFKDKPFKREDGYTVDLKYDPENKKWTNQRVGGALSFAGENYIIVAITKNELVVLGKSNQKKTPVPIVSEATK